MKLMIPRPLTAALVALVAAGTLSYNTPLFAGGDPPAEPGATFRDAIGSWFGRAVPIPGETICPPGAPGCPVPPEIVMEFTVGADGSFIGIDSILFSQLHTPAHGAWERQSSRSIKAEFTLMQSQDGHFIGGFKNILNATVTTPDEMRGTIDARLYGYTNPATGAAIVDADGFPTPSPLAPPSLCDTTPGCTHLGRFSFLVRRVKVH